MSTHIFMCSLSHDIQWTFLEKCPNLGVSNFFFHNLECIFKKSIPQWNSIPLSSIPFHSFLVYPILAYLTSFNFNWSNFWLQLSKLLYGPIIGQECTVKHIVLDWSKVTGWYFVCSHPLRINLTIFICQQSLFTFQQVGLIYGK